MLFKNKLIKTSLFILWMILIISELTICQNLRDQKNLKMENVDDVKYDRSKLNKENVMKLFQEIEHKKKLVTNVMKAMNNINKSINAEKLELDVSKIPTFNQISNNSDDSISLSNPISPNVNKIYEEKVNLIANEVYRIKKESEEFKNSFRNMIEMEESFQKKIGSLNDAFENLKSRVFGNSNSNLYQDNSKKHEFSFKAIPENSEVDTGLFDNKNKLTNRFKNKVERIVFGLRGEKKNINYKENPNP